MKKAIVTGANGFVGSALCRELAAQGVEVFAVLRGEAADHSRLKGIDCLHLVYCELSEIQKLASLIPDRDIGAFYHFAWAGTSGKLRGDYKTQLENVQYTCDTVRVCKELNCSKFIFASSIMEYEVIQQMESEYVPGINTLYSSAKVEANYMARILSNSLGIAYIRGVISNIYGPGEKSQRLINSSIRKMLSGEHCAFTAGEQMYDFIYISDAAKVFAALADYGISNRSYYIGSLKPRPLKEFLLEIRDSIDPDISIGLGEIPFDGSSLSYSEFDLYAVKEDTGIEPEVDFKEGIQRTIKWIKGEESDVGIS